MERTVKLPVWLDDTVYKICPKCNPKHNETCENCAWSGCKRHGCDIGVGIYPDGSYNKSELQVVPVVVTIANFFCICVNFGTMYFDDINDAETALLYYDNIIRKEPNKEKRIALYETWVENNRYKIEVAT